MKRLIFGLLFAIFGVSSAFAVCPAGTYFTTNGNNCVLVAPTDPLPIGSGFTQTARAPDLTATNTTGSVALGASAYVARVCNTSSTVSAYIALGNSSVTVTTANGILVPAGQCANLNIGTATYLAGITSSSTAVLQTSIGSGLASLGGGGSANTGGTVTSVSVTTQNGVSASVTNPTTTPALAFTLGAITPSSAAIGAGSAITSSGPGGVLSALGYTVPGTGVATALGVNIGSAGAPVLFNGAGGTPSSMTATNLSGTAASLTAGNVTAGWHTLARSNVEQTVVTGIATKTTSYSVVVPAGTLNTNGSLRISFLWTFVGTIGTKQVGIDLGGFTFYSSSVVAAASLGFNSQVVIANRNSASAQIARAMQGVAQVFSSSTTANVTGAIDTTANQTLTLWVVMNGALDTGAVESVMVEYNND